MVLSSGVGLLFCPDVPASHSSVCVVLSSIPTAVLKLDIVLLVTCDCLSALFSSSDNISIDLLVTFSASRLE